MEMKTAEAFQPSAPIRTVRFVYGLLAAAYFACVVLQVFFAGMGIFVQSGGRIRGGLRWLPLALFALTSLQHMTIRVFTGFPAAFHTVDALLLFWISLHLMQKSWRWLALRRQSAV